MYITVQWMVWRTSIHSLTPRNIQSLILNQDLMLGNNTRPVLHILSPTSQLDKVAFTQQQSAALKSKAAIQIKALENVEESLLSVWRR